MKPSAGLDLGGTAGKSMWRRPALLNWLNLAGLTLRGDPARPTRGMGALPVRKRRTAAPPLFVPWQVRRSGWTAEVRFAAVACQAPREVLSSLTGEDVPWSGEVPSLLTGEEVRYQVVCQVRGLPGP